MGLEAAPTFGSSTGHTATRAVIAGGAAAATGAVAAVVRPLFGPLTGSFHPEAVAAVFGILPAIGLVLVLTRRHVRWTKQVSAVLFEFLAVPAAFVAGWSLMEGRLWPDLVGVMFVYWSASTLCAFALLAVLQRWRPPRRDGFCPGCDYCLNGVVGPTCPECGRPLDDSELGIGGAAVVSLESSDRACFSPTGPYRESERP
ncbi:MAG: hypothetical protein KDA22_16295 [Phycisphaerales bacterium]|nr:hypothetical protein [Phycisphaerales bacterium]